MKNPVRGPLRLKGFIQHYDWGGYSYIPKFLGIDNREQRPYAELWLGAHPKGPSMVAEGKLESIKTSAIKVPGANNKIGSGQRLDAVIVSDPLTMLGERVIEKFGASLPYLFKILDAREMLSIQVHPSKEQAQAGFAAEEAAGAPIDSPQRNYKDANHKPEVHLALSDFYMLHGFRPLEEIADVLHSIPSFETLAPDFRLHLAGLGLGDERRSALLRDFYSRLMQLPQAEVDRALDPLLHRLEPLQQDGSLKKISPHYWAVRAARLFPLPQGHRDRGIFSIYLLNLMQLKPGQGTFQPAGLLHAYLEGTTIELMANSDNVLRGGLTAKCVDVGELLKIVDFTGQAPVLIKGRKSRPGEMVFHTNAADFQLSRIELGRGDTFQTKQAHAPEIWIVLKGAVSIPGGRWQRGDCCFIPAAVSYSAKALESTTIYRATVPDMGE